jgi:ribosome biogenesis GTPase
MDLATLGWTAAWQDRFQPYAERGLRPGRIAIEHKNLYHLYSEAGELPAVVSGKLRHEATARGDFPAVGDWVALVPQPTQAVIHAVLPRVSKFSRKMAGAVTEEQVIAANIDTLFLMTSLNYDLNPRRLERYLTLAQVGGAQAVLILSKLDLCGENPAALVDALRTVARDVPIHPLSARTGEGLEQLEPYLRPGRTIALLGSSGVGKSTLVNRLLGTDLQAVQEIRLSDDRGRHTTTRRELLILPGGGLLIDNPGMRELQLWEGEPGLEDTFADISAAAEKCFFRDCRHKDEPRCAVQQAVADGRIDPGRLASFLKMQKELAYLASREDSQMQRERKEYWRRLTRSHYKQQRRREKR